MSDKLGELLREGLALYGPRHDAAAVTQAIREAVNLLGMDRPIDQTDTLREVLPKAEHIAKAYPLLLSAANAIWSQHASGHVISQAHWEVLREALKAAGVAV